MKYCPNCAYKLAGTEKFCPECSYKLAASEERVTTISDTSGDVTGAGFSGSGNIIGKEVRYIVQGNVLNLQISGDASREVLDTLQKIMSVSRLYKAEKIYRKFSTLNPEATKDEINEGLNHIKAKLQESEAAQRHIETILNEVNKIEEKSGKQIEGINVGDLEISKRKLLETKSNLKGSVDLYKSRYDYTLSQYNEASKIDQDQTSKSIDLSFNVRGGNNKDKWKKKKSWFRWFR